MTTEIIPANNNPHETGIMESVLIAGDLSKLTPQQRVDYYMRTCSSLGLNPLTRPFDYITLNGRLTLYAKKDTTDQLRKLNGVSIDPPTLVFEDDLLIVTITGQDKTGRRDTEIGVVNVGNLKGDAKANATMKAVTKAKRRLTLSICGLGWTDESEVVPPPPTPGDEPANDAAWGEFHKLANRAEKYNLTIYEPVRGCSTNELRAAYRTLKTDVDEYEARRMNGATEEG